MGAIWFSKIQSPQVMNVNLWKVSGALRKISLICMWFKDDHDDEFGIKWMSCPGHVRIFIVGKNRGRDLPVWDLESCMK